MRNGVSLIPSPQGTPSRCQPIRRMVGVLLLVLILGGCGTAARTLPVEAGPQELLCCTRGEETITLQYLGTGGWLFRMGDASLLTAPFFSNPGLVRVGLGELVPDTAAIDNQLPPVEDVPAILVGHAHYDHLMDVPYIARRRAPDARVYGSRTAVNLLQGDPELDSGRLVEVESLAGDHEAAGEWIPVGDGRIRFMPLRSGHAPHFMGIHLYRGEQDEPAPRLPETAWGWLEGQPLAYLIDFLDEGGDVAFRVHYQDAASEPPDGLPPPLEDGIPVDLVILCPPGYQELTHYPEGILERTRPTLALLGHWENFFRSATEEPSRAVPGTDLEAFIQRMEASLPEEAQWRMPNPGTVLRIGGRR
jgi:hypothetical protein